MADALLDPLFGIVEPGVASANWLKSNMSCSGSMQWLAWA